MSTLPKLHRRFAYDPSLNYSIILTLSVSTCTLIASLGHTLPTMYLLPFKCSDGVKLLELLIGKRIIKYVGSSLPPPHTIPPAW